MASAILGGVAKMAFTAAAGKLKNEILGRKYGDATQTIEVILAAQKESFTQVHIKIEQVVAQNEFDKEALQIEKWADDLKERLEKAKNGEDGPLKELYRDLNDTDHGVQKRLLTINGLLTGTITQYSNRGLIELFLEKLYTRLGAHDDMDYRINNYLTDIAKYLECQFKLQETAFSLRLAAATESDPVESWKQKINATRLSQITHAWDRFPPMIRKMKADFGSAMDPIHWWRLKGGNGKYLTRDTAWLSNNYKNTLEDTDQGPCPGTEWRFQPSLDSDGLTRIQTRSDKGRYVAGYWSTGSGGIYSGASSRWSVTYFQWSDAAESKIVPEKTGGEPKFKIVPKERGLRGEYPFNKEWVLTDDGVGQWD